MNQGPRYPGFHPDLTSRLIDEIAKLRAQARDILRMTAPPRPDHDQDEHAVNLWNEAWDKERRTAAATLSDAAFSIETSLNGLSPTHDLMTWRKSEMPTEGHAATWYESGKMKKNLTGPK